MSSANCMNGGFSQGDDSVVEELLCQRQIRLNSPSLASHPPIDLGVAPFCPVSGFWPSIRTVEFSP